MRKKCQVGVFPELIPAPDEAASRMERCGPMGIRRECPAASHDSTNAECVVHNASGGAFAELYRKHEDLRHIRGFDGKELIRIFNLMHGYGESMGDINGCRPDGGIFCLRRGDAMIPILGVEAKFQNDRGNAIERWYKNYYIFSSIFPRAAYLTFCSGPGAAPNGVMSRALNLVFVGHASREKMPVRKWDHVYTHGPSLFRSVDGFSEDHVNTIILNALKNILNEVG